MPSKGGSSSEGVGLFWASGLSSPSPCTPEHAALIKRIESEGTPPPPSKSGLLYCAPSAHALDNPSNHSFRKVLRRLPPRGLMGLRPRRTCAVVGNSGLLNSSGYGALIDSHDVVIRVNTAPTHGHEWDVGARTTIRLLMPSFIPQTALRDRESTEHYLAVAYGWSSFEHLLALEGSEARPLHGGRWALLSPDVVMHAHALANSSRRHGSRPTQGLTAAVFARLFCERTHLFGFSFGGKDWRENMHYYHMRKAGLCTLPTRLCGVLSRRWHDPGAEYALLRKWAASGQVGWFPPVPDGASLYTGLARCASAD
jgi:hypothetical protein